MMDDPWHAPDPPIDGEPTVAVDPRVDATHTVDVLPCPKNPPPPAGWEYWKGSVPDEGGQLAKKMLHDPVNYPMGTFLQARLAGMLIGARVEWHDLQGATGKRGCFRGVNLMRFVGSAAETPAPLAE